ncbi:MAG: hypothetical protein OEM82_00845 [Acidobacteriota bacterium]|nr:hypothetical protein [Acidobacteriota bacterium]MDH3529026.1 hypothetical protein [Acidobacteriota bacterium]
MRYFADVSKQDRQKIGQALRDIRHFGDRLQVAIARFIEKTELNLFVGPVSVVRGSGSVQLENHKRARKRVEKGTLDLKEAARHVRLNIARETIDTGGQRGIEGTLVHEGKHALDFARMLSTASLGDVAKFFNPTAFQKEYSAHLTAALYLRRRGGEYADEGIRLGLLKESGSDVSVDPEGIRDRLSRNYGLSPERPGARLETASDPPIRPAGPKISGLF